MNEIDKARTQRDAQRKTTGNPAAGNAKPYQSMLRYLGVNLYRERKSAEADEQQHDVPKSDK